MYVHANTTHTHRCTHIYTHIRTSTHAHIYSHTYKLLVSHLHYLIHTTNAQSHTKTHICTHNAQAYIHILAQTRTLSYTLTRNTQLNTNIPTGRHHSYTLTFTRKLTNIAHINSHVYSDTHAQHTTKQYTIHKQSRKHSHKLDTHTHAYSHTNHNHKITQTHTHADTRSHT